MVEPKQNRLCSINDVLPPEMIEKILKLLNFKEKCQAQLICRRWKSIVEKGNLLTKAAGKISFFVIQIPVQYIHTYVQNINIFSYCFLP